MCHSHHPFNIKPNTGEKPKHDFGTMNHADIMPMITIRLADGHQFSLPVWALFWIGPLMWWGVLSLEIVATVAVVALVFGVRVHFAMPKTAEEAPRKPKNDDDL